MLGLWEAGLSVRRRLIPHDLELFRGRAIDYERISTIHSSRASTKLVFYPAQREVVSRNLAYRCGVCNVLSSDYCLFSLGFVLRTF